MPRHILIKLTKTKHKERLLKAAREKQQVTYKWNPIHLIDDLSAETLPARREWQDTFQVLKGKNLEPRLLYPAKISFKIDGEIKSFSEKQKVKGISTTKSALPQMLKGHGQEIQEKKKICKIKPQTIKKMAIGTYISTITLNVNGLNASTKGTGWLNGYKNKTHIYAVYKKPTSDLKTHVDWKWEGGKIYPMQMESKRKLE